MDLPKAKVCLQESLALLQNGGSEELYSQSLISLKELLELSLSDHSLRDELATSDVIPATLQVLAHGTNPKHSQNQDVSLYYRLLRGVILLLRNLVVASQSAMDVNLVFEAIESLFRNVNSVDLDSPDLFFSACFAAYAELLANCSLQFNGQLLVDPVAFAKSITKTGFSIAQNCKDVNISLPLDVFIANGLSNSEAVSALLMHSDCLALIDYLSSLDLHETQKLLPLIETIICHEKFHKWITTLELDLLKIQFLKTAQIAATSNEDWDNHQCVTILNWALDLVKQSSVPAIHLLEAKVYDVSSLENLHLILVCSLDILSDLGKFNCAQQFFLEYKALEVIVPLFRAIYENVEVRTAKKVTKNETETTETKTFPIIRSLIIEIMAFTCQNSYDAQERIRELHGLELVLSSCVIDDNNPFMKERAILCLKFLLEKNQKNQQFVAELEANKVADSSALEAAGYELDVVGGKLKVKSKN